MKHWTQKELVENGYEIINAQITNVSLNMKDHGCLSLDLTLKWNTGGCVYGGYYLGRGYLNADDDYFKGSEKGCEAVMRIMDTVGESELLKMKNKYIRVAYKGLGNSIKIIGNIIKDKWFDYGTFYQNE